jgi:pimeloyl-ACP methyl ester carboxylesterase
MLLSLAALVAVVVLGVPLFLFFAQDRLLFFPQPLGAEARQAVGRQFPAAMEILLQAEGGARLHAWHVPAEPGKPLLIYFGGNGEEVSWMLGETGRLPGTGWLLTSYRGYGGSEGAPSAEAITADALRWYDYAAREIRPAQVFAFGRSLGSGAAVQLAAARPLAGVILVTPFDSLSAVAKRHYPVVPVDLLLRHRFDSDRAAPKLTLPLLCLAAERDEVIPPAHARRLFDLWAGPKQWVMLAGASHNDTDSVPDFWRSIAAFLREPGM